MRLKKLLFISYNKIGVSHKLSFPPKLFGLPFFIPHFFGVYGQHQQNQKRKTSASSKKQWTWRDLNPRHLRCERSYLPLIYKPETLQQYRRRNLLTLLKENPLSQTFAIYLYLANQIDNDSNAACPDA